MEIGIILGFFIGIFFVCVLLGVGCIVDGKRYEKRFYNHALMAMASVLLERAKEDTSPDAIVMDAQDYAEELLGNIKH